MATGGTGVESAGAAGAGVVVRAATWCVGLVGGVDLATAAGARVGAFLAIEALSGA